MLCFVGHRGRSIIGKEFLARAMLKTKERWTLRKSDAEVPEGLGREGLRTYLDVQAQERLIFRRGFETVSLERGDLMVLASRSLIASYAKILLGLPGWKKDDR